MAAELDVYAARLQIDYAERRDRVTSLFRLILVIPIGIIFVLITSPGARQIGTAGSLAVATAAMIVFRQRYPRWWFDFAREMARFGARVGAYVLLLTDEYPSTVDEHSVRVEIDYPDVQHGLNRWLPLFKWLLAIPHYIVLAVLAVMTVFATIIAWFAIIFTGRYPRTLFDFVVGVGRWALRVQAYAMLLVTDRYPPFSTR